MAIAAALLNEPLDAGRRILVADDHVDSAQTAAEILEMLGFSVRIAYDGMAAVAKAVEFRPEIVLLDIGLPDIDGYEVARRLRAQETLYATRIIAMTGWEAPPVAMASADVSFDEYWVKPIELCRLSGLAA